MMGHKICFNGEIWIIIPKLSPVTSYLEHCNENIEKKIIIKIKFKSKICRSFFLIIFGGTILYQFATNILLVLYVLFSGAQSNTRFVVYNPEEAETFIESHENESTKKKTKSDISQFTEFLCPATKSGGVLCYTLRTFECLSVRLSVRPSVRPSAVEHSCPVHNFDTVRDDFTKLSTNINHDQTTCRD